MNSVHLFIVLSFALTGACASIPTQMERSTALSAETFDASYRVAVTSVMKKPDVSSAIGGVMPLSGIGLLFNVGAAASESGARKHVGNEIPPLERIDAAMQASLHQKLGVTAKYLPRASFGGDELAPQVSNIAFDAFTEAKAQGYDALFFVHLQPALSSATGGGKRHLSLTGTPVFKSVRTDALMFFEDDRVECAGYEPIADEDMAEAIGICTDEVIAQMTNGLNAALESANAQSPAY